MVTFSLVVGGILGALFTGALQVSGYLLPDALIISVVLIGALAFIVHAIVRYLLDSATTPTEETDTDSDADTTEGAA
jgi:uncharacterized membrane protein